MADAFVLDTSALLALRSDEAGAERVDAILRLGRRGKARNFASFMTRMELLYRVTATESEESARDALRLIDAAGVSWVTCEPEILEMAARFKARGGLSVADAWIAATAAVKRAVLVHKDPEFGAIREIDQERLPS
jgi:ribonuclease VapC